MKFTISTASAESSGLRVIPALPDMPLCRVEGRNGIGKTLAARLLELASGVQPFAALPHAWTSLVEGLGAVTIQIEGFSDAAVIECRLDSKAWSGRSATDCALDPGEVSLNGVPIGWDEARTRFQVRRIAGDEGLQETLGRLMRERSLEAERHAATLTTTLASWAQDLRRLHDMGTQGGPRLLDEARVSNDDASNAVRAARSTRAELSRELEGAADRQADLARRATSVRALPSVLDEYQHHRSALDAALLTAADDDQLLVAASVADHQGAERARLLRRWSRLLQLRERARDRAASDLRYWRRIAGATENPLELLRDELRGRQESLRRDIESGYLAGSLRGVLGEVLAPIARIGSSDLAHQVFATIDRPISGVELRNALTERRVELTGVPKPEAVASLEKELADVTQRLAALEQIPGAADVLRHKQDLVDEAESKLQALLSGESEGARKDQLLTRLAENRQILTVASGESGRVAFEIASLIDAEPTALGISTELSSGDDEQELTDAAIDSLSESTGLPSHEQMRSFVEAYMQVSQEAVTAVEPGELFTPTGVLADDLATLANLEEERIDRLRARALELDHQLESLRREQTAAAERLASIRLALRSSAAELADPEGPWHAWSDAFGGLGGKASIADLASRLVEADPDSEAARDAEGDIASVLARIGTIAADIEETTAQSRDTWTTISAYLEATARRLAPRLASAGGPSLANFSSHQSETMLRRWTEHELARILSSEALRRELFDDATDVSIDLDALAVLWRTPSGRRRRRPLEAFSSGEQVFAYTRAKLDQLSGLRETAERTTVILDEFGAFVARDRFGQLMRYVEDEAVGTTADQIVVMLPWSGVVPTQGSREADIAAQADLETLGYFAIPGIAGGR